MTRRTLLIVIGAAVCIEVGFILGEVATRLRTIAPVSTPVVGPETKDNENAVRIAPAGIKATEVVAPALKWTSADVQEFVDQCVVVFEGPGNSKTKTPLFSNPEHMADGSVSYVGSDLWTQFELTYVGAPSDLTAIGLSVSQNEGKVLQEAYWRFVLWQLLEKFFKGDYQKVKEWFIANLGSAGQLPGEQFKKDCSQGSIMFTMEDSVSERSAHNRVGGVTARWAVHGVTLIIVIRPPSNRARAAGHAVEPQNQETGEPGSKH